jgi:hypothetical protein
MTDEPSQPPSRFTTADEHDAHQRANGMVVAATNGDGATFAELWRSARSRELTLRVLALIPAMVALGCIRRSLSCARRASPSVGCSVRSDGQLISTRGHRPGGTLPGRLTSGGIIVARREKRRTGRGALVLAAIEAEMFADYASRLGSVVPVAPELEPREREFVAAYIAGKVPSRGRCLVEIVEAHFGRIEELDDERPEGLRVIP